MRSKVQKGLLLFFFLFLASCSSYRSQLPDNEAELFKSIKHDQFDDGFTAIVDDITTPYYRLTSNNDIDCALRGIRLTTRNPDQRFLEPISYYVICDHTNKEAIELNQAKDHYEKTLDIEYKNTKVFSDGKKDNSAITKQTLLIKMDPESLAQTLTQREAYKITLKTSDINKRAAYLNGIKIEIPARLLQGFFQYSKITWIHNNP